MIDWSLIGLIRKRESFLHRTRGEHFFTDTVPFEELNITSAKIKGMSCKSDDSSLSGVGDYIGGKFVIPYKVTGVCLLSGRELVEMANEKVPGVFVEDDEGKGAYFKPDVMSYGTVKFLNKKRFQFQKGYFSIVLKLKKSPIETSSTTPCIKIINSEDTIVSGTLNYNTGYAIVKNTLSSLAKSFILMKKAGEDQYISYEESGVLGITSGNEKHFKPYKEIAVSKEPYRPHDHEKKG